jgi:predicted Zn-dependent protease
VTPRVADLVIPSLVNLSTGEEAKVGKLLYMMILANHGSDEDGPYQRAVVAAARPVVEARKRKDVEITITVLDSNDVNAFSHLGGYIYLTRGLFNLAATDEEFRFVVAHELAHIDAKDALVLADEAARRGVRGGVGALQSLYHQIALGYTEAMELRADDRAIDELRRLDHTKLDFLRFLRKLQRVSEEQGYRNGEKAPKSTLADSTQDVANHIKSQPAAWKRLSRQEQRINSAGDAAPSPSGPPSK